MFKLSFLVFSAFVAAAFGHECDQDWIYHGGSCYGYGNSTVSWGDAQVICRSENYNLAVIDSVAEDNFLINLSRRKNGAHVWIGATEIFHDGIWQWITTQELISEYTNWGPGEPDNDNEDWLQYYKAKNYTWNDGACSMLSNFICEKAFLFIVEWGSPLNQT